MLYYSKDGVSVAVWQDNRKQKDNGTYPVKVRVTFNRQRSYYPTGKDLTAEEWAQLPHLKGKEYASVRRDIESSYMIVRNACEELTQQGAFSFDALRIRLRGAGTATINDALRARAREFAERGSISNAILYTSTAQRVEEFGGKVPYNAVTANWLQRFEAYMRGRGNTTTTIAIRLSKIKAVMNEALRLGIIRDMQFPFGRGKYQIQQGAGRKLALTIEQIGKVARYEARNNQEARYRDYWLFLYYCNGINVADFARLRWSNIVGDEIYYKRQKTANTRNTEREICVPIIEPMCDIMERWGNAPSKDGYIFPHLNGTETPKRTYTKIHYLTTRINGTMAEISEALGLPHISTYTARHSFATVLKRSGANIAYISEAMGHSDLRITENYLASFESEERRKNAQLLTMF